MTQSFDVLKKIAIADILSVSGKDKAARVIENHMNNLIEVALIKGAQSRQAEIDELQKRIDEVINLIEPSDEISHKLYRELIKVLKGKQDD